MSLWDGCRWGGGTGKGPHPATAAPAAARHACTWLGVAWVSLLFTRVLLHLLVTRRRRYTLLLRPSPPCTFLHIRHASAGPRVGFYMCKSKRARMREGLGVAAEGPGRLSVPASIWLVRAGRDGRSHPICWQSPAPSAAPLRHAVTLAEGSGSVQGGLLETGGDERQCPCSSTPRSNGVQPRGKGSHPSGPGPL